MTDKTHRSPPANEYYRLLGMFCMNCVVAFVVNNRRTRTCLQSHQLHGVEPLPPGIKLPLLRVKATLIALKALTLLVKALVKALSLFYKALVKALPLLVKALPLVFLVVDKYLLFFHKVLSFFRKTLLLDTKQRWGPAKLCTCGGSSKVCFFSGNL